MATTHVEGKAATYSSSEEKLVATFFVIEASHLFRAGDKFKTQFFVLDVVKFLKRKYFQDDSYKTVVLHGSTKDEQATRYANALERHDVKVIRMNPIPSLNGSSKHFYKPTWYLHQMLGKEIPTGSSLVLIGFHNSRYLPFLQKYHAEYKISMAAFTTPSRRQGWLQIPEDFKALLVNAINLDDHVSDIKAEWRKK
jgi:hypothetical protein